MLPIGYGGVLGVGRAVCTRCRTGSSEIGACGIAVAPKYLKLSIDRIVQFGHLVGSRGFFRDSYGGWVHGFCKTLGNCTIDRAELSEIYLGLTLAWSMGIRQLLRVIDNWPLSLSWERLCQGMC
ncbi:hypothetical protein Ancab_029860 [Ancistrocladus abbreviatus]